MPWKVISPMDQKMALINAWRAGASSITELAQHYGISRPTVYKWLQRYDEQGLAGLQEHSRAPTHCPHRTPAAIRHLVVQEKLRHRQRGPRKVRAQLHRQYPGLALPAISTIAYWLNKEGLVARRKPRRHVPPYTQPFRACHAPNDSWSIDYKGQFYLQNGRWCYPLTISDNCSRFLLGCRALAGTRYAPTRQALEAVFREYGLPAAIRSDNGTPFAGPCVGGLSRLSIWFIQLGIVPERIGKGCPQENGRHERMHRTLKSDALQPAAQTLADQQARFDVFRQEYNDHRPHEALQDQTPSEHYQPSTRPYMEHPHPPAYGAGHLVRQVRRRGEIKLQGQLFFITELLAGQSVGLHEIADGLWQLQYGFYVLGAVDLRKNKVVRHATVSAMSPV